MAAADVHYQVAEVYGGDIFSHRSSKSEVQNLARNVDTPVLVQREREEEKKTKKTMFKASSKPNK